MLATGEEITRVSGSFCAGDPRHATSRVRPPSEARIMVRLPRNLSRVAVACSLALPLASVLPAWAQVAATAPAKTTPAKAAAPAGAAPDKAAAAPAPADATAPAATPPAPAAAAAAGAPAT